MLAPLASAFCHAPCQLLYCNSCTLFVGLGGLLGRARVRAGLQVVVDFHDRIKNLTSGYASFNYVEAPPRPARLVKVRDHGVGEGSM